MLLYTFLPSSPVTVSTTTKSIAESALLPICRSKHYHVNKPVVVQMEACSEPSPILSAKGTKSFEHQDFPESHDVTKLKDQTCLVAGSLQFAMLKLGKAHGTVCQGQLFACFDGYCSNTVLPY